jgi:hypothetical protein
MRNRRKWGFRPTPYAVGGGPAIESYIGIHPHTDQYERIHSDHSIVFIYDEATDG